MEIILRVPCCCTVCRGDMGGAQKHTVHFSSQDSCGFFGTIVINLSNLVTNVDARLYCSPIDDVDVDFCDCIYL